MARKYDDYEGKLGNAEKRVKDFQRKSDVADEAINALKEELNSERRRSIALDKNYQEYQKEMAREKKTYLERIEEEKAMNKKYGLQIKDYNNQLQKTEEVLHSLARQSEVYE